VLAFCNVGIEQDYGYPGEEIECSYAVISLKPISVRKTHEESCRIATLQKMESLTRAGQRRAVLTDQAEAQHFLKE
jgi:hypothetical protein